MENFQEIADQFRADEALVQVGSVDELAGEVSSLLLDEPRQRRLGERARDIVDRNRGAVARSADALAGLLR
jgi:3-deoxy-D-manno-octulosonic-acid transferase